MLWFLEKNIYPPAFCSTPVEWKCSSPAWVQLPTMPGSRSKEKFCWCASCEAEEVVELCLKNLTVHFFLHLLLLFFVWTAFAVPPPTVYLHRIFWNGEGKTQTNNDKNGKKKLDLYLFYFCTVLFHFFFCFLRRRFHIMKVRGFRDFLNWFCCGRLMKRLTWSQLEEARNGVQSLRNIIISEWVSTKGMYHKWR